MDDASPTGAPDLRITQPIPTFSMSRRYRPGRKVISMAVVWLQQVGSQMVWVERPVRDVTKECAESYSTHFYCGLQLGKADVPQT